MDKVVVITGGARGIGRAIAKACHEQNYKVVVAARSQSDLDETKKLIPCTAVRADVSKSEDVKNLMKKASEQGQIYGLICAAAIYGTIGKFKDTPFDEWEKALTINTNGTARTVHEALQYMKKDARIILFSGGGQGSISNFSAYTTSKGGVWRLTETLGEELAKDGIFLNAIAPGLVNTQFLEDLLAAGPEKVGKDLYEKSLAQKKNGGQGPEKAANLCLYLLGEKARGLAGKTISAIWDPISDFKIDDLMKDEIYSFRRVVDHNGNTRVK